MDGLVTWLRAQLDADEAAARAAYDEASDYEVVGSDLAELHFVNWKPDRVLRDITAKRAIVDHAERAHELAKVGPSSGDGAWFLAVRYLAVAYEDRLGYDDSWRP